MHALLDTDVAVETPEHIVFRHRVAGPARRLIALPRAVRRHRGAMLIAFVLFVVPFAGGLFGALNEPSFAFQIVPEAMLRPLTEAYAIAPMERPFSTR